MHVAIVTPVRLGGEGLAAALARVDDALSAETLGGLARLREGASTFAAAIIDVMLPINLSDVREFHDSCPTLPLLALGLREHETEVVAHGRAGFVGYICRDDGAQELCRKVHDAVAGRPAVLFAANLGGDHARAVPRRRRRPGRDRPFVADAARGERGQAGGARTV